MHNEGEPSFEVPSQPEVPAQSGEQIQEQQVEHQRPATQEAGVGKRAPQPPSTASTDVVISDVPEVGQPTAEAPTQSISPLTADIPAEESDLMGKAWVERVKVIENQTQDDPHQKADQIGRAGVDYRQKRFNRSGKLNDAPST